MTYPPTADDLQLERYMAQFGGEMMDNQSEPIRGIDPEAHQRVIAIVGNWLTDRFDDFLAEDMPEYILTEYADGFLVTQVTADISEGIRQWAEQYVTSKALEKLVFDCCESYLGDDEEFQL